MQDVAAALEEELLRLCLADSRELSRVQALASPEPKDDSHCPLFRPQREGALPASAQPARSAPAADCALWRDRGAAHTSQGSLLPS